MSVLRIYTPAECDQAGVPLDWVKCRYCAGTGQSNLCAEDEHGPEWKLREGVCVICEGHGSLKAAALIHLTCAIQRRCPDGSGYIIDPSEAPRCEDCNHPQSDGTWEGDLRRPPITPGTEHLTFQDVSRATDEDWQRQHARAASAWLLGERKEPPPWANVVVHYSPCDEGCRHSGPGRLWDEKEQTWRTRETIANDSGYRVEASWRQVDIRRLNYPNMLRPEDLAVLCLRCWAKR